MHPSSRREFLRSIGLATVSLGFTAGLLESCGGKPATGESTADTTAVTKDAGKGIFFRISLAEWSLHRALGAKEFENLDFPVKAKNEYGISAVEYVNQFFMDKATDAAYLNELKKRCDDNGVTSVLIMCDSEGNLADTDGKKRQQAVENHYKWIDAAKFLGCHSIRVNCAGSGTKEEVAKAGVDGLRKLSERAQASGLNVIVENHGGYSSNSEWLTGVISTVNLPNCGTLPDFGNFCIVKGKEKDSCDEAYDQYKGVTQMMPYAKGVSAKSKKFDGEGNCLDTDYAKMLPIVKAAGYTGYIGIEYEGETLSEPDGIRATKKLLEKVGAAIS